jgi:hypothetical protein
MEFKHHRNASSQPTGASNDVITTAITKMLVARESPSGQAFLPEGLHVLSREKRR